MPDTCLALRLASGRMPKASLGGGRKAGTREIGPTPTLQGIQKALLLPPPLGSKHLHSCQCGCCQIFSGATNGVWSSQKGASSLINEYSLLACFCYHYLLKSHPLFDPPHFFSPPPSFPCMYQCHPPSVFFGPESSSPFFIPLRMHLCGGCNTVHCSSVADGKEKGNNWETTEGRKPDRLTDGDIGPLRKKKKGRRGGGDRQTQEAVVVTQDVASAHCRLWRKRPQLPFPPVTAILCACVYTLLSSSFSDPGSYRAGLPSSPNGFIQYSRNGRKRQEEKKRGPAEAKAALGSVHYIHEKNSSRHSILVF